MLRTSGARLLRALQASTAEASTAAWGPSTSRSLASLDSVCPSSSSFDHALFPPSAPWYYPPLMGEGEEGQVPPQLCAVPKRKLSLHRRGNRRIWYQLQRKREVAVCTFCGVGGARGTVFTGHSTCTGACLQPSAKVYPEEYTQPC